MLSVELPSPHEGNNSYPFIGLLLTAGLQTKQQSERIEPDLEGKVRSLGALHDLVNHHIDHLFIVGGQKLQGKPLAEYNADYLKRFENRYPAVTSRIETLPGGIETGSDLHKAVKTLAGRNLDHNLRVYTTSFHGPRAVKILNDLGYDSSYVGTEHITRTRSPHHLREIDRAVTDEFLKRMTEREKTIMALLKLDGIPVIGKRILPGMKLVQSYVLKIR